MKKSADDKKSRQHHIEGKNEYVSSNEDTSGSEITPCNKIDKPLVVYRFSNVR